MKLTKAREALRERIVEELGLTADSRVTLAGFIEQRWKPLREGTWRDSTKQTNTELLKVITDRFGTVAVEDMDGVHMQQWLNTLAKDRSGSVVKHCRIFLKSICAEAMAQGYIRRDPARQLRVPIVRQIERHYLTEAEIKDLLKATWTAGKHQPREKALLHLMLMTAMRPSELFALRWRCLSTDYQTATLTETVYRGVLRPFTKTTEEGATQFVTVFIPATVAQSLEVWRTKAKYNGPDDFVFANSEGGWITKENYQRRVLNPLADHAQVKRFNYQMLRRSVATHLQHLGSPKDTATIMRHRKPETAQEHYVQTVDATVRAAQDKLAKALLR
ncbi:MAG: tyrosine-type recombinase/integrase [Candidatus Sulfotelmatobacter sp.]